MLFLFIYFCCRKRLKNIWETTITQWPVATSWPMAWCFKSFSNHVTTIHYLLFLKVCVVLLPFTLYTDKTNFAFHCSTYKRWYDSTERVYLIVSYQSASFMIHSSIYLYWFIINIGCSVYLLVKKYTVCPLVVPPFLAVCLRDTVRC